MACQLLILLVYRIRRCYLIVFLLIIIVYVTKITSFRVTPECFKTVLIFIKLKIILYFSRKQYTVLKTFIEIKLMYVNYALFTRHVALFLAFSKKVLKCLCIRFACPCSNYCKYTLIFMLELNNSRMKQLI